MEIGEAHRLEDVLIDLDAMFARGRMDMDIAVGVIDIGDVHRKAPFIKRWWD